MNVERLLRRLRAHPLLWGDDKKADQISRLIDKCKARLMPVWNNRAESLKHKREQRLLYLTD